jgi:hypothetical protein
MGHYTNVTFKYIFRNFGNSDIADIALKRMRPFYAKLTDILIKFLK